MGDEGEITGTSEVTVEDLEAFADAWDRHEIDTIMTFFTDDCVFIAGWGGAVCWQRTSPGRSL